MKTEIRKHIGVLILCGGNSERMNFPKAFLTIENKTLIEHIAGIYTDAGFETPIIVMNKKFIVSQYFEVIDNLKNSSFVIENGSPENGRLYSIKLGLNELKDKEYCFIQNVDNPSITTALLNKMIEKVDIDSYVSPSYKGKSGHPLLLGKKVISEIINSPNNDVSLKEILSPFKKNDVDSGSLNVLENVNSPLDWEIFTEKYKTKCKV